MPDYLLARNEEIMKPENEILPEYDFSNGERGKYSEKYKNSNVCRIDQDLMGRFPTSEEVNQALREYLRINKVAH